MPDPSSPKPNNLQRSLTLKDAILFGIGGMLGAGVYAIIGEAAGLSGNLLWLAFLVAALIAFLTALSYAEFVSRFPDSGGSFEYVKQSLGEPAAYGLGIAIYLLVAISAVSVLDWQVLGNTSGPLSSVIETRTGRWGAIALAVVALFATSKTILSNILGTSRLVFDMARDSEARSVKKMASVAKPFGTPVFAILLVSILAIAFALIGNLSKVASISNTCVLTVFATVNVALIVYRCRHPDGKNPPFRVPGTIGRVPILPVIAFAATILMLVLNVYNALFGSEG